MESRLLRTGLCILAIVMVQAYLREIWVEQILWLKSLSICSCLRCPNRESSAPRAEGSHTLKVWKFEKFESLNRYVGFCCWQLQTFKFFKLSNFSSFSKFERVVKLQHRTTFKLWKFEKFESLKSLKVWKFEPFCLVWCALLGGGGGGLCRPSVCCAVLCWLVAVSFFMSPLHVVLVVLRAQFEIHWILFNQFCVWL